MSVFHDYFFRTLRWPLASYLGPLAMLVAGLARCFDQVREDIVWLRNQFNPWTCDPEMIPAHAESRGLTRYDWETDEQYINRCIRAFAWHRLSGGNSGMPRILEHFGFNGVTIHNVRKDDEARWAEFKPVVPVPESGLAENTATIVSKVSNETKPARSLLAGVGAASSTKAGVVAGGITYTTIHSRLVPERVTSIEIAAAAIAGGYVHTVARSRA